MNNPYADIQTADNVRVEKLEQRQRALERRVRKTKREVMGLQEAVEKCQDEAARFELQQTLDRKSYLLSRQNEAYNEFCKENSLRPLSERLQIARWNREQAAKSQRGGPAVSEREKGMIMPIMIQGIIAANQANVIRQRREEEEKRKQEKDRKERERRK